MYILQKRFDLYDYGSTVEYAYRDIYQSDTIQEILQYVKDSIHVDSDLLDYRVIQINDRNRLIMTENGVGYGY